MNEPAPGGASGAWRSLDSLEEHRLLASGEPLISGAGKLSVGLESPEHHGNEKWAFRELVLTEDTVDDI